MRKHTSSGETHIAVLREEIKWRVREIRDRLPQRVTQRICILRIPNRESFFWWVYLLNTYCHLLYSPMALFRKAYSRHASQEIPLNLRIKSLLVSPNTLHSKEKGHSY